MDEWGKVFQRHTCTVRAEGRIFRCCRRIMASDTRTMSPEGPSAVSRAAAMGSDKGRDERPLVPPLAAFNYAINLCINLSDFYAGAPMRLGRLPDISFHMD